MILRTKQDAASAILRPHVTPDPKQAAELQRRLEALNYRPNGGFHRDRPQHRLSQSMNKGLNRQSSSKPVGWPSFTASK